MKTDAAKTVVLAAIRRNLAASAPFDAVHEEHHAPGEKTENTPISIAHGTKNLAAAFHENLAAVGGNCEIVADKLQAAALIQTLIAEQKIRKIAVSNSGLVDEIRKLLETDAEISVNAAPENLFECDLGLTSAQFGVAETGTLVIESEKEFNRLTSLVPPIHVCVLETAKIRRTLGEVLEILKNDLSPAVTFITGPSRTSDIELTLAIGVHGPAQLYVILIDETEK